MENLRSRLGLAAHTPRYSAYGACQHGKWRITWCFPSRCEKAAGRGARTPSGGGSFSPAQWRREPTECPKKRPLAVCKRPKSREETPKEGGGNANQIALPRCSNMPPRRTKRKCGRHIFDKTGATRRRTPGSLEATGKNQCGLRGQKARPGRTASPLGGMKPNQKPRGLFHDGGRFCRIR